MPVARSDPRRATVFAAIGLVAAAILVVVVLIVNASGRSTHTTTSHSEIHLGSATDRANDAAAQPLLIPDTANGSRPFYVTHTGTDATSGWSAFDAIVEGCPQAITWDPPTKTFTDCHGSTVPVDGGRQQHYLVTVASNGDLVVNVNPDALTSTTSAPTTTTIKRTGG